jgi:hypothetical protein
MIWVFFKNSYALSLFWFKLPTLKVTFKFLKDAKKEDKVEGKVVGQFFLKNHNI